MMIYDGYSEARARSVIDHLQAILPRNYVVTGDYIDTHWIVHVSNKNGISKDAERIVEAFCAGLRSSYEL